MRALEFQPPTPFPGSPQAFTVNPPPLFPSLGFNSWLAKLICLLTPVCLLIAVAIYCSVGALHPAIQNRPRAAFTSTEMLKPRSSDKTNGAKTSEKSCSQFTGVFTKPAQAACSPQSWESVLRKPGNKHRPVFFQWGAEPVCWLYLFIVMNYLQVFPKWGLYLSTGVAGRGFPATCIHPKRLHKYFPQTIS